MTEWRTDKIKPVFSGPGWERPLRELRRICAASAGGQLRGTIVLRDATRDEKEALGGFFGTYTPPSLPLRFSVRDFERRLAADRLAPDLLTLFEQLDGAPLRTRGGVREAAIEGWEGLFVSALADCGGEGIATKQWLEALRQREVRGARTLQRMLQEDAARASLSLRQVLRALRMLEESGGEAGRRLAPTGLLPLPIVAARATGDAHGLDWDDPRGRLFWFALEARRGPEAPAVAEMRAVAVGDESEAETMGEEEEAMPLRAAWIRSVYRRAGVQDDDLSAQVLLFAPYSPGGAAGEEQVLTLRQVERLSAPLTDGDVYAVENPSIFTYLLGAVREKETLAGSRLPTLVCVSGQPNTAVIGLLEHCVAYGSKLHYAGDFDVAGVEIANRLARRFADAYVPWRMDADDYRRHAPSGVPLTAEERIRVSRLICPWAPELPQTMGELGRKVHQELLADELLADWLSLYGLS